MSIVFYILYVWISDNIMSFLIYKSAMELFETPDFYLTVILNTSVVFILEYSIMYYRATYHTTMSNYFQYLIKTGREDNIDSFYYFDKRMDKDEDIDYRQPKTPTMVRPVQHKGRDLEA